MKISLITATLNSDRYLFDCLSSIAKQDYGSVEHVLVDGASTDRTLQVFSSIELENSIFVSEPDNGIYQALNKGIRISSGSIIGFMHADDVFASHDVLSRVAEIFLADPHVDAVFGDLQYVKRDNVGKVVRTWVSSPCTPAGIRLGWMPPHPTLYVRREWYEKIGGFDEQYLISADYLSVLHLFSNSKFKSVHIPRTLVKMRVGGISNRSFRNIIKKSAEDWRALKSVGFNSFSGLIALISKNLRKLNQLL